MPPSGRASRPREDFVDQFASELLDGVTVDGEIVGNDQSVRMTVSGDVSQVVVIPGLDFGIAVNETALEPGRALPPRRRRPRRPMSGSPALDGGRRPRGTVRGGRERGSVTTEMVLVFPIVIMFLFLVILAGRVTDAKSDVVAAANDAARVASLQASGAQAAAQAQLAAEATLAGEGIDCVGGVQVDTWTEGTGGFARGAVVVTRRELRRVDPRPSPARHRRRGDHGDRAGSRARGQLPEPVMAAPWRRPGPTTTPGGSPRSW